MPKRKRSSTPKRTPRKKPRNPWKGKPSVNKLDARLKKIEKSVEWKREIYEVPPTLLDVGHCLFQGPSLFTDGANSQVDGDKICLKKLKFKFSLRNKFSEAVNVVKFLLIRFPRADGFTQVNTNGLANAETAYVQVANQIFDHTTKPFISTWKKNEETKYQILMNKDVQLGSLRSGHVPESRVVVDPVGQLVNRNGTRNGDLRMFEHEIKIDKMSEYMRKEAALQVYPGQECYMLCVVPYYDYTPDGDDYKPEIEGYISAVYTDL